MFLLFRYIAKHFCSLVGHGGSREEPYNRCWGPGWYAEHKCWNPVNCHVCLRSHICSYHFAGKHPDNQINLRWEKLHIHQHLSPSWLLGFNRTYSYSCAVLIVSLIILVWKIRNYHFNFSPVNKIGLICFLTVGYNNFVTSFNRSITLVIAGFRYVYVFHWLAVISDAQKKRINNIFLIFLFGSATVSKYLVLHFKEKTKRYTRCMGREEEFFYNIPFFLEQPRGGPLNNLSIWHPVRLYLVVIYNVYIVVVPIAYIKIFRFRKLDSSVISEEVKLFRKRRNIVSTWYNMAVWLAEGVVTILVRSLWQKNN